MNITKIHIKAIAQVLFIWAILSLIWIGINIFIY